MTLKNEPDYYLIYLPFRDSFTGAITMGKSIVCDLEK